jgi:hypothetical protein
MIRTTRGLVTEALTNRGSVATTTFSSDSGGGASGTVTYGTAIPCRLDALGGGEGEIADRISDRSTHLVTLPPETAITTDNDFAISGEGAFEVTAVREHTDEFVTHIEVVRKT